MIFRCRLFWIYVGWDMTTFHRRRMILFAWLPRPDQTPEGDLLHCAFGITVRLGLPRPWMFEQARQPWALRPNEYRAADWTGREVEVLEWRWPIGMQARAGYLPG